MKRLVAVCVMVLAVGTWSYGAVVVTESQDGDTWTYTLTNDTDDTIWNWAVWFTANPHATSVTTDTDGWLGTNLATQGFFPQEYVEYWGDVEVIDSEGNQLAGPDGEPGFYQVYAGDFVSANPREYDEDFDAWLGGKSGWDGVGADIRTKFGIGPGGTGTMTVVVSSPTTATSFSYNTTDYWYSKMCLSSEDLAVDFEDHGTVGGAVWYVPSDDHATIQDAIDDSAVTNGDTIIVAAGSRYGAYVDKSVAICGEDGAVIDDGPLHPAGLTMGFRMLAGSDGTTISGLGFTVDLAIMNGEAVDDVTVEQCTFTNTVQAVSNWRGSGWSITDNIITDLKTRNGGGIGILVGDYLATDDGVKDNLVSDNVITGTLHVGGWYEDPSNENGGYNGTGVVLYADFRWGMPGALEISGNRIRRNTITLHSDNPDLVDVAGIELTDTRDDITLDAVIYDNSVVENILRGMDDLAIALTPENLEDLNEITGNPGAGAAVGSRLSPGPFGSE